MASLRPGRCAAALVLGIILIGCQAAPGQSGAPSSSSPSGPAPSYLQGGVTVGGGANISKGPHTPRGGNGVVFFGPESSGHSSLDLLDVLDKENYKVTFSDNGDIYSDDPGNITLTSFKGLAASGIAIVNSEIADLGLPVEYYCDPLKAADALETSYSSDVASGYLVISAEPGGSECASRLNNDEQHWTDLLMTATSNQIAVDYPRGVDPGPVVWAIAVTKKGLEHYFQNAQTSLLYFLGCGTSPLVQGISTVEAIFGYADSCSGSESDVTRLLMDMAGDTGDQFRSTTSAFYNRQNDRVPWGTDVTYQASGGPVLLSPAVIAVDPSQSQFVEPGKSTEIKVSFDTEMSESQPVQVQGCGASIDGAQTWIADDTLTFKIMVPQQPPDKTLEVRIKYDVATASADSGWANQLSGNGTGVNGLYPNQNDYHWDLNCAQALDLKVDGQFQGQAVSGQIIGYPTPVLTCDQMTSGDQWVGNIVHWNGYAEGSNTPIGGEFDVPFGTSNVGTAVGDQSITIDMMQPFTELGGTSGTITQNQGGGSVDATASNGGAPGDSIHVTGTWTCPSGSSPAP